MTAREELTQALASADAFDDWLASRGFAPADADLSARVKAPLRGARIAHAEGAPRLLTLWRDFTARSAHGRNLREIQREANALRVALEAGGVASYAPDLCLVACSDFLVVFPIDGDPFARRQRFTADALAREDAELTRAFRRLDAAELARLRTADAVEHDLPDDDPLAELLADIGEDRWTFEHLYAAQKLDDEFVWVMSDRRRRLVSILVDPAHRDLLADVLARLEEETPRTADGALDLPALLRPARVRNLLVAVADTVLLRLVLHRYLEAQYGPDEVEAAGESRTFAFGSYDDALDRATEIDRKLLDAGHQRMRRAHEKVNRQKKTSGPTLDLFAQLDEAPPVSVKDPEPFRDDIRQRSDHYQRTAGGDLHLGRVARAADALQRHLLERDLDFFATLLHDTRADRYSFHWADLDPKAFQQFYEQTIGTDIRLAVDDPGDGDGTPQVRVVPYHRTRKEQGAFYTQARLCDWLVARTVKVWFGAWHLDLSDFCKARRGKPAGRLAGVRARLDRLLDLRIIDPTCGGGIFLRAAFQYLVTVHRTVVETLTEQLPAADHAALFAESGRYALFAPSTPDGEWEWYVLLHMLYGVDVDMKAINVASNLLTLSSLAYKPGGLRFPSFINANLKPGNALVVPFTGDRRVFAEAWRDEIAALIALRARLRDLSLDDAEWTRLHDEARALTAFVTTVQVESVFGPQFPGLDPERLMERVKQVGVFLYEIEFPEVFFEADGSLRDRPGFDIVLGNPPWEEPAAEYKHFLPEFDPAYRKLDQKASLDRETELLEDPIIAERWERFTQSVDDYKALLTTPGIYRHQRARVHGKIPGAHTNLYKYATERTWHILADDGRAGLVVDNGLWGDVSATGLRRLLLDQGEVHAVIGFVNSNRLFDIDPRQRFACVVFAKGGRTETLRAVFMRSELSDLDDFDQLAAELPVARLRADADGPYKVPEIRSAQQWHAFQTFAAVPRLGDAQWNTDTYSRELNAGEQRHFFHTAPGEGFYPLIQGTQFNHFGVHQGELPDAWVDPGDDGAGGFLRDRQIGRIHKAIAEAIGGSGSQKERAEDWLRERTGSETLPPEWLRLDWDGYRLAWREIARNDDRRSMIAGILPPRVACSHKAPFIRPFTLHVDPDGLRWTPQYPPAQFLYLAGMLSSFACDAVARTRLAKTTMTKKLFLGMPVPAWTDSPTQRRVAELCCDLTCLPATAERPWADYTALAAALDRSPATHGLTDPAARREAEVELNALAAALYGLDRAGFRYLMDELFMTPKYRDEHGQLRDDIAREMPEEPR